MIIIVVVKLTTCIVIILQVTHLVAGQVGSTKYQVINHFNSGRGLVRREGVSVTNIYYSQVAQSLGTPVLRPSWITTCWEEGRTDMIEATAKEIVRGDVAVDPAPLNYRCSPDCLL